VQGAQRLRLSAVLVLRHREQTPPPFPRGPQSWA